DPIGAVVTELAEDLVARAAPQPCGSHSHDEIGAGEWSCRRAGAGDARLRPAATGGLPAPVVHVTGATDPVTGPVDPVTAEVDPVTAQVEPVTADVDPAFGWARQGPVQAAELATDGAAALDPRPPGRGGPATVFAPAPAVIARSPATQNGP